MENNSDEIDLIEQLKTVWDGRKQVIIISFVFALIGVAVALLSPVIYSSSTTFINSQTESNSPLGLSGVASLVGINLGGYSGSEIPPTIYPQIGESVEFKRSLLKSTVDKEKQIKLESFLADYNQIKTPESIENNKLFIPQYEDKLFDLINDIISLIRLKRPSSYSDINNLLLSIDSGALI